MNFINGAQLLDYCEKNNKKISEAMFERETTHLEADPERTMEKMRKAYSIMKGSVKKPMEEDIVSMGGMIGGESKKLHTLRNEGKNLCGSLVSKAIAYAMGVLEVNASMGLIVAAPTAGSSGVIPGVLCSVQEEYGFSDEEIVQALFNAGGIGYLITRNATTAGAEGGCQAEVGSASAMAASAVVELMGGTPSQCMDAASLAIVNILGLVCDPIGGLVENPCQNRNAMGASNALVAAELVLAGIKSITPIDETIEVMYAVGKSIPSELRETSMGGLAVAKSACETCRACAEKRKKAK
ncbi:MAG: L-serine ammonia-lyase, iron-sulfur-dependent, subunit alpha [Lachnospiraceae bacterium]|nr:L-serine ammonia-lyase, iron-sulfur-dependent, subunit alpha [Lachnospiraceae bacterium]